MEKTGKKFFNWKCFGIINGRLGTDTFKALSEANARKQFNAKYPNSTLHKCEKL